MTSFFVIKILNLYKNILLIIMIVKFFILIKRSKMNIIMIFTLFVFLTHSTQIYCYIDPVSGSMIVQALIAGFVGGGYLVKVFWRQIKDFFKNILLRIKKRKK